jgi:hypothetical protein
MMIDAGRIWGLTAFALGAALADNAAAEPLSDNPISIAVRRGDCRTAVDLVLRGVQANDGAAVYLGGRMLDTGVCVQQDLEAAGKFFERASVLGNKDSSLDYATKVGLGEGFEQSYQRAGEICRKTGLDPQQRLSDYSLGYACTLSGAAGRFLREHLPAHAFRPDGGPVLVEFNPASAEVSIRQIPEVVRETEPLTGSRIRKGRVDARRAIDDAWQKAVNTAPKPEAPRLTSQVAKLSLDVDMALDQRGDMAPGDPDHTLSRLTKDMFGQGFNIGPK